jgi:hypothetical protein
MRCSSVRGSWWRSRRVRQTSTVRRGWRLRSDRPAECAAVADRYVFSDEAGNFDFSSKPSASRYFVLCTVTADHCGVGDALLSLRRELGWKGMHLDRV